jgi:uncharacterized membrane protein
MPPFTLPRKSTLALWAVMRHSPRRKRNHVNWCVHRCGTNPMTPSSSPLSMSSDRKLLVVAIVITTAIGVVSSKWLDWQLAIVLGANCFFVAYLVLALTSLDTLSEEQTREAAVRADVPTLILFALMLATVTTAFVALFRIINADERESWFWLIFAMLAIPFGWATMHTMMAFHYAQRYWQHEESGKPRQGLQFPGESDPNAWDFIYFAFVIGMAAQTSDVSISDQGIRRTALAHSVVSYFFNAVLIAAAVNVAVAIA